MAKDFNIEELVADLSLANEVGGDYGYSASSDGKSIVVEQYSDEGDIEKTYTMTIEIKEAK
ncbi:hypothetical protein AOZ07_02875 [Glutamicibacter halophytocola]|uniref:hypothetical protein n=1 Tax=Glutamicibacter halophytocola TaxID=1933880 RepID=UPI0006D4BE63|nr:hypothetical protein [Glutamicibacter halophytocola]ALG28044.1 hypothetical protein AOZ07_02875 [Glutamicibacter halophytocola]